MYYVYAILSKSNNRIYVGLTANLNIRIKEHNCGRTKSTKSYRPWALLYSIHFNTRLEARAEEKRLKSGVGKEFLNSLIDSAPIAQMDRALAF